VRLDYYVRSEERRTFTYCKPLVVAAGHPPVELNRLDTKNWTPTPKALEEALICHLQAAARSVDAVIVLDQVDTPETGVVTSALLRALRQATQENPQLLVLADSRRGLRGYPPVIFKMNAAELGVLTGKPTSVALNEIQAAALALASANRQRVFVTLSERGLLGASPEGQTVHVPALPLRGPIDVVGAGDAVTANLTAALAAGASLAQAVEIANAAASIVVHKLGTTGTANLTELAEILAASAR
jgi:bifunctional ADP-heptose synthase (sugar kinase/adenylyltransferase)